MSTFPEMFEWEGGLRHHPLLQRDAFHLWLQQTDPSGVPFPVLPMPSPAEMQRLLEAVGWSERQASVRFQVPVTVMRSWLGGASSPQDHQFEYTRLGAQAAWSALAHAASRSGSSDVKETARSEEQ